MGTWACTRQGSGRAKALEKKTCGEVYNGNFAQGHRHGKGKCIYSNGEQYIGQWRKGWRHGQGRQVSANGDFYEGSFDRNRKDGHGMLVKMSCEAFIEDWKCDVCLKSAIIRHD